MTTAQGTQTAPKGVRIQRWPRTNSQKAETWDRAASIHERLRDLEPLPLRGAAALGPRFHTGLCGKQERPDPGLRPQQRDPSHRPPARESRPGSPAGSPRPPPPRVTKVSPWARRETNPSTYPSILQTPETRSTEADRPKPTGTGNSVAALKPAHLLRSLVLYAEPLVRRRSTTAKLPGKGSLSS